MTRDDNPRFRITAWPASKLPIPWGPRSTTYKIEGTTILASADLVGEPATEHHEVYLDLLTVDLEDEHEILAFVNRHGPLSVLAGRERPFNGFTDHPYFRRSIHAELQELRDETVHDWIEAEKGDEDWIIGEPVDEFRWEAACLRDMVAAWRFVNEGKEPERLWSWVWGAPPPEFEASYEYSDPLTLEGAAHLLARGLDVGLAAFHPYVQVGGDAMPYHGAVGFYQVCCLELFNHIVENATYRICQNEPCQRVFVRQTGRAEHGQYRSEGVKYCSRECARAQAQRNYRRRNRIDRPE
jgi:hypothetical protein